MIRLVFTLLIIHSSLYSNTKETCLSVQLFSRKDTKSIEGLKASDYPKECKAMIVGTAFALRCGCYKEKSDAQKALKELQEEYKQARVVTTYKYRFDNNTPSIEKALPLTPKQRQSKVVRTGLSKPQEELKLILQVFLYKGDLENAYKVASMGYKMNPNSYYWNQKMAEICKWTNRSARSMKHLRFMYEKKYDKKIEEELIQYGTESYQYEQIEPLVVSKAHHNPTEKNVDLMILVYKKIGTPEKVVAVLENEYKRDPQNNMFLTKALALSLEMEDMELASKYVAMIEAQKPYSQKDAALISNYYYVNHDIESAYKSLHFVDTLNIKSREDNVRYYELKSDLGWYLQDNINAAKASQTLIELQSARLVDYERVAYVNKDIDPKLATIAEKKAYKKFRLSYLFYSYANNAMAREEYEDLREVLDEIDKEKSSPLRGEALYWIVKSKVYAHFKEKSLQKESVLRAMEMSPDNMEIKLLLIYYYIEADNHEELKIVLTDMSETPNLDLSYYFPIASAYFYLGDVNRASMYTQKLINAQSKLVDSIEFKFMQAYIYQSKNNQNAFQKIMIEIEDSLKKEAKKTPELKRQDRFLSNYLRAAIHVLDADAFRKKLKKAKQYLSKQNYDDISYSFAIRHEAYEKSRKIYHQMDKKELWLIFSNNLLFNNHSEIENLLSSDLEGLAMGDASQAAYKDGQKALSQSVAYEGLLHNDDNQNAYIQHLDISKERSDKLSVKLAYNNRDPLLRKYTQVNNVSYLHNGNYFLIGADYYLNSSLDEKLLINEPPTSKDAMLGYKTVFDKGHSIFEVSYYDSMDRYYGYSFLLNYRMSTDLVANVSLAKNENAIESIPLLLGGNRDKASLNIIWSILNSTSISFSYEKYRYHSQDKLYLGEGEYKIVSLNYQIRNGYPDMKAGLFYDTGKYKESDGSKGVIELLQREAYAVLPEDFYSIGAIFSYGMVNSDNYTRVWRPYAEISTAYSSVSEDYTYNVHVGIGGKILHQDHLSIGASYSESISGIGTQSYEIYLNYRFFYTGP